MVNNALITLIVVTKRFTGYTTDPFSFHDLNTMKFTTRDKDNDRWPTENCANRVAVNSGGWWYNSCAAIYLNNQYKHKYVANPNGQYHFTFIY